MGALEVRGCHGGEGRGEEGPQGHLKSRSLALSGCGRFGTSDIWGKFGGHFEGVWGMCVWLGGGGGRGRGARVFSKADATRESLGRCESALVVGRGSANEKELL